MTFSYLSILIVIKSLAAAPLSPWNLRLLEFDQCSRAARKLGRERKPIIFSLWHTWWWRSRARFGNAVCRRLKKKREYYEFGCTCILLYHWGDIFRKAALFYCSSFLQYGRTSCRHFRWGVGRRWLWRLWSTGFFTEISRPNDRPTTGITESSCIMVWWCTNFVFSSGHQTISSGSGWLSYICHEGEPCCSHIVHWKRSTCQPGSQIWMDCLDVRCQLWEMASNRIPFGEESQSQFP